MFSSWILILFLHVRDIKRTNACVFSLFFKTRWLWFSIRWIVNCVCAWPIKQFLCHSKPCICHSNWGCEIHSFCIMCIFKLSTGFNLNTDACEIESMAVATTKYHIVLCSIVHKRNNIWKLIQLKWFVEKWIQLDSNRFSQYGGNTFFRSIFIFRLFRSFILLFLFVSTSFRVNEIEALWMREMML